MVNICMMSVSDSSAPAKLNAAATHLKVKVFGVLAGVCVVFLGCWLVCVWYFWGVGWCLVFHGWLVCVVFYQWLVCVVLSVWLVGVWYLIVVGVCFILRNIMIGTSDLGVGI